MLRRLVRFWETDTQQTKYICVINQYLITVSLIWYVFLSITDNTGMQYFKVDNITADFKADFTLIQNSYSFFLCKGGSSILFD